MKKTKYESFIYLSCCLILLIYFLLIVYVNFYGNATLYDTDMYSDMMYAVEVWEKKSIFSENWCFGNQLYVIATPVLAAFFYGLTHDPVTAMGMASLLMSVGVIVSFYWLLKPLFKDINTRLLCCVVFMSVTLFCGGIRGVNGWQLFFAFCSYYACYAITCFLCFGCYLRSNYVLKFPFIIIFILSGLCSFATGVQSLRQTAVMILPLLLVEFLKFIYNVTHKNKIFQKSLFITLFFSVANILGVIYSKLNAVEQTQIFGEIKLAKISDIIPNFISTFNNVVELFNYYSLVIARVLVIVILLVGVLVFIKLKFAKESKKLICILLMVGSLLFIGLINIFTTMSVRPIYYFIFFPLVSIFAGCIYVYHGKLIKHIVLVGIFAFASLLVYLNVSHQSVSCIKTDAEFKEVSEYLLDNDITTIYTCWGLGDNIAIVSDFKIKSGFWNTYDAPFECVTYLCSADVFSESPGHCAYVFRGQESVDIAISVLEKNNLDYTFNKYFPDGDIYVYTSKEQVLHILNEELLN